MFLQSHLPFHSILLALNYTSLSCKKYQLKVGGKKQQHFRKHEILNFTFQNFKKFHYSR